MRTVLVSCCVVLLSISLVPRVADGARSQQQPAAAEPAPTAGVAVSGTLVSEDGGAPPFPAAGVQVVVHTFTAGSPPVLRQTPINPDWSFKIEGLAGAILFGLSGVPEEWMLETVWLGVKEITDAPFEPAAAGGVTGVRLVVSERGGSISGTVLDGDDKPAGAAGVTVLVFPENPALWTPGSRFVRTVHPDANGAFAVKGLPAATYRAIALPTVKDRQWEDKAFLEEMLGEASRMVLPPGASGTVKLRLHEE